MTNRQLCCALISSWLCGGCVLLADKADYADYREIRLSTQPTDRAIAMRTYVERHPRGRWRDEVEAERKREELQVFESGKDTRAGLEHYLRAFPDGTFVGQARSRLKAVALIEQQRQREAEQAAQVTQLRKARAEELRRTWMGRFLAYWVKTLAELQGFGEPIADVARQNPQFSRAFGALPRPRCTQDECVKYYTSAYAVPVPGGNRLERTLSLLLRLRLRAGKLERAELLLPDRGFSRWYELENRREVPAKSRDARVTAMNWAIERALPGITALGDAFAAVPTAALPTIEPPAIGPTGELLDTSIEAPTDPQNRSASEDNAGIGVDAAKPRAGTLGAPTQPEAAQPAPDLKPDMKFDAVGVGRQGQRVEVAPEQPAPKTDEGAATEMLFTAPLEVPKTGAEARPTTPEAKSEAAPAEGEATPAEQNIAPVVRTFQSSTLRITLFAAGSEGSAYDGIVVERIAKPKRAPVAKPPAAPAPAAQPAQPAAPATEPKP